MGCASSKKIEATNPAVIYRPPPSSFAIFDINAVEEPWLKLDTTTTAVTKPSHVPAPLLEKLDTLENEVSLNGPPRTWDEVSKALEDLHHKPTTTTTTGPKPNPVPAQQGPNHPPSARPAPRKSLTFHTVEELDSKKSSSAVNDDVVDKKKKVLRKSESMPVTESTRAELPVVVQGEGVPNSVKVNPFILRDRMEREKEGKVAAFDRIMKSKRDPLIDFPEKCPPGGAHLVVLYTTSLGGVRRTFEDCNRVRAILENHRVVFDERDVSLHGEFLSEMRDVVGEAVVVPRLFVKGRYLGGADEVVELNESGRLGRIMSHARVERGPGWQGCEGCGGARFVPCLECGGSCKVMVEDKKERCTKCNENGLVHCPLCH